MDSRVDLGAMAFVLKIKYADTLRRMIVKPQGGIEGINLSYAQLEGKIRNLFTIPTPVELVLTYKDKEDDVVTISQDEDLEDALVIQGLNPLRIDVSIREDKSTRREDKSSRKGDKKEAGGKREARSSPAADTPSFADVLEKTLLPTIDSLKNIASGQLNNLSEKLEQDKKFRANILSEVLQVFTKANSKDSKVSPDSGCNSSRKEAGNSSDPFSDPTAEYRPPNSFQGTFQGHGRPHTDGVFHYGVQCDRCGVVPIVGPRYKSNKKEDYDLCVSCFTDSQASEADYVRYDQPIKYHGGRHFGGFHGSKMPRCPYFQPSTFGRPACGNRGGFYGSYGRHDPRAFNHNNAFGKLDCRFVRDVTIFDGTEFAPGMNFTKIWKLRNSGNLPWPQNTQLVHIGGDELGSVPVTSLELPEGGLLPDCEIEASVDLTAPNNPGRYISHWRLLAPSGAKFGHRVWVSIQVVSKDEQSPQVLESLKVGTENNQQYVSEEVRKEDQEDTVADIEKAIEVENISNSSYLNAFSEVNVEGPSEVNVEGPSAPVIDMVEVEEYRKFQVDDAGKFSPEYYVNETANLENSELGPFSLVDVPKPVTVEVLGTPRTLSKASSEASSSFETEFFPESTRVESIVKPQTAAKGETLLNQLEIIGFTDRILNLELLEKNDYDLQMVLDELFSADKWDPMLDELQDMGFTDVDLNRRLMFKNKGSLKHVVKDLVLMYKDSDGKNKETV
ncbi:hypothetical protein O6H91_13G021300 [Diphasiastrum complanatum]|uniref:Uncharacterized protein n=1 Tax=Diphasiastrum complanatum TaxID=34168 RepID=A0ACC2BST5_DIPCM|nr:hypothetical protein O6H91_13G021300 [Diphasiastrum complanatum]